MSEREAFQKIVSDCPVNPLEFTCEWIRQVRDEGYSARMHGGVLHGMIIDHLVELSEKQSEYISEIVFKAERASQNDST